MVPVCEMDTPCCGKQCCSVVYETSRHHVRPTCAVVVIAFRSRTYKRCLFLQAVFVFRRPCIVSQTLGIKSAVTALLRAAWCFAEGRYRWTSLLLLLGAFAKFRKAAVGFVMSVCLSVRTHGTTRLPLYGFSRNLMFVYFSKLEKIQISLKLDTPHDGQCTFLITSRSFLLRTRNVTHRRCKENRNIHFVYSNFFFRKSCRLCDNLEKMWWSRRGHRCQYNTAHALCMLVNLRLQTHSK